MSQLVVIMPNWRRRGAGRVVLVGGDGDDRLRVVDSVERRVERVERVGLADLRIGVGDCPSFVTVGELFHFRRRGRGGDAVVVRL